MQFYVKMGVSINQKRAIKFVLRITCSFWGKMQAVMCLFVASSLNLTGLMWMQVVYVSWTVWHGSVEFYRVCCTIVATDDIGSDILIGYSCKGISIHLVTTILTTYREMRRTGTSKSVATLANSMQFFSSLFGSDSMKIKKYFKVQVFLLTEWSVH